MITHQNIHWHGVTHNENVLRQKCVPRSQTPTWPNVYFPKSNLINVRWPKINALGMEWTHCVSLKSESIVSFIITIRALFQMGQGYQIDLCWDYGGGEWNHSLGNKLWWFIPAQPKWGWGGATPSDSEDGSNEERQGHGGRLKHTGPLSMLEVNMSVSVNQTMGDLDIPPIPTGRVTDCFFPTLKSAGLLGNWSLRFGMTLREASILSFVLLRPRCTLRAGALH